MTHTILQDLKTIIIGTDTKLRESLEREFEPA
jgi:hypothetical protein